MVHQFDHYLVRRLAALIGPYLPRGECVKPLDRATGVVVVRFADEADLQVFLRALRVFAIVHLEFVQAWTPFLS